MSVLRMSKNNDTMFFPDNYPVIDVSNLISTALTYTATEPCFAFPRGVVTLNGVSFHSQFTSGVCILLGKGDTIQARTSLYIYGLTYIGGD